MKPSGGAPTVVITPLNTTVRQKFLMLDALGSTDPSGLALTFSWMASAPSTAVSGANTATP
ncbi:MAG TPA: hypothetical protein VKV15_24160 [Bryobacteraceae bacterium]|nr:hypothetical protein [Bryobacteraceae bacterium]